MINNINTWFDYNRTPQYNNLVNNKRHDKECSVNNSICIEYMPISTRKNKRGNLWEN